MILELFGPPGAGKTTFVIALERRLRERGHITELNCSARPAERLLLRDPNAAAAACRPRDTLQRLGRPAAELLTILSRPLKHYPDFTTASGLMRVLPERNLFQALRRGQYIIRLARAWRRTLLADRIRLFDQAFVQTVCSLASVNRVTDAATVAHALDCVPAADLLVRLDAPAELLKRRLRQRRQAQNSYEQLLELDPETSVASVPVIDRVHEILSRRGPVITATSLDQLSLGRSLDTVEACIIVKLNDERWGRREQQR